MKLHVIFAAALALAGCGARNDIVGAGGAGASASSGGAGGGTGGDAGAGGSKPKPEQLAQMGDDCAPNDGHAVGLVIAGVSNCDEWNTPISGLHFLMYGQGLANLHAGGTVKLAQDFQNGAEASRWTITGQGSSVLSVVSGTLSFATFVEAQGATGTYDVTFEDATTEKGSFSALWCDEPTFCG